MKAQGSGDIINISSLAATKSGPGFSAYASSKHALNSMSDGMRQEVGGPGNRVSIVMPGATRTEVFDHISHANLRDATHPRLLSEQGPVGKGCVRKVTSLCCAKHSIK